ncbi:hypothetical protein DFJ63DRAFT_250073 [Scheffersomyces coipomensis]|uniref:uncharacterized protein n=1 Tax=Scheffersomyces coipomensis TaxID=1788519 RepID=UPI00315CBA86
MSEKYQFGVTSDPAKLREIYTVCGDAFSATITPEEFADLESGKHVKVLNDGGNLYGFYVEEKGTGKVIASTTVREVDGFFKAADRSSALSSVPDPAAIGVKNVKFLLVGYVSTHKDFRNQGIAKFIVGESIKYLENDIITRKLKESDASKKDSFKNMVTKADGQIDTQLANYYLSKEYFWYLYSGVGKYYERFGFKAFPMESFRLPHSIISEKQESIIKDLIKNEYSTVVGGGKKLKLLRGSNLDDQNIINSIYQRKELEILTDLNKMIFHSELQGSSHHPSSSLTNVHDILESAKSGSSSFLSSITEDKTNSVPGQRRKSSAQQFSVSKVALKPDYETVKWHVSTENHYAKYSNSTPEKIEFTDIQGAILTNELQQKSYYILWNTLMQRSMFILGMGELHSDPVTGSRRSSSFGTLNELGGYNFQDWDILLATACYVGKNRSINFSKEIYLALNDLPSSVPTQLFYDHLLNYFPNSLDNSSQDATDDKVEIITDCLTGLPMIKLFGSESPNFDLDWTHSGVWSWG